LIHSWGKEVGYIGNNREMPSSPIEIAEKLGITVSYISQQLKLLKL
jgi:DNA-binding MarR family transcriptional regulator